MLAEQSPLVCDGQNVRQTVGQSQPAAGAPSSAAAPGQHLTTLRGRGGAEEGLHKHGAAIKAAASPVDIRTLQFECESAFSVRTVWPHHTWLMASFWPSLIVQ